MNGHSMRGVMYEPIEVDTSKNDGASKRIKKRRRQKLLRQQGAPKQNKTAFNYFSTDVRPRARELCGPSVPESEVSKKIGELWLQCPPNERQPYLVLAKQDRQRYINEMEAYQEKLWERQVLEQAAAVEDLEPSMNHNFRNLENDDGSDR